MNKYIEYLHHYDSMFFKAGYYILDKYMNVVWGPFPTFEEADKHYPEYQEWLKRPRVLNEEHPVFEFCWQPSKTVAGESLYGKYMRFDMSANKLEPIERKKLIQLFKESKGDELWRKMSEVILPITNTKDNLETQKNGNFT